jgi:1-acyl-sn-glycerol-3-phosphate acyltransferase
MNVGTMWLPQSSCGTHCLDDVATVGRLRQVTRLVGVIGVLLGAIALVPFLALTPEHRRHQVVRACARGALRSLGIRWTLRGKLPARRALVVANHVSWLDIVVILAAGGSQLVAKTEVRDWPVIGRVAVASGVVFLDRTRPKALLGAVAQVRAALAGGAVVSMFPEGTTSCGEGSGGFRPAFFQAALDARAAVVPLTLRYQACGAPTAQPAFIGMESLMTSLRRVLAVRQLSVGLTAGTAIHPASDASRRTLAHIAAMAVGCPTPARPLAPAIRLPAIPLPAEPADLPRAA